MEITLRKFESTDAENFFQAVKESVGHVSPWLAWCDEAYNIEKAQHWVKDSIDAWETGREYRYVIIEKHRGEILGSVAINQIVTEHRIGNIGYWVRKSALGSNVCTKAVKQLVNEGFQRWGFQRLEIVIAEDNLASCRVAEKVGAIFEGTFNNKLRLHERPIAAKCYSLVP